MPLSVEERDQFLAEPHIGALSVASDQPDRGPLTLPIWYVYEPGGELWITTERNSPKGRLIAAAGRFSLMVDRLEPTVRYVSVEGEVTSIEPMTEDELTFVASRYLPKEKVAAYVEHMQSELEEAVTIRLRPRRWYSADLGTV